MSRHGFARGPVLAARHFACAVWLQFAATHKAKGEGVGRARAADARVELTLPGASTARRWTSAACRGQAQGGGLTGKPPAGSSPTNYNAYFYYS